MRRSVGVASLPVLLLLYEERPICPANLFLTRPPGQFSHYWQELRSGNKWKCLLSGSLKLFELYTRQLRAQIVANIEHCLQLIAVAAA